MMEYIKGMTWGWLGRRGTWKNDEASRSMALMTELGINWTAIAFQALQDTAQSTDIAFRQDPVITDEEVIWAVHEAKKHGLKVCLKPVVNCKDGTWRAHICFFDEKVPGEPSWDDWFASYEQFILHYARLAEDTQCEMFCVGCEMVQSDKREKEWRRLIHQVRQVYSGVVTYNCDKYQEERVGWWDAVDVISSSGYYPEADWDQHVSRLSRFVDRWQKPFFFMEAGCPSREGSAAVPNDWKHQGQPSVAEQDRYYGVMLEKIGRQPWFHGFMFWSWPARLYDADSAAENDDYCIYGKPAAQTVRQFYDSIQSKRVKG